MHSSFVRAVALLALLSGAAAAGLQVVSPDALLPHGGPDPAKSMREKVLDLQTRQILDGFSSTRQLRASGMDRHKPSGRGGAITGAITVSPAAPAGLAFDGEILALDRHGFVAGWDFWFSDGGSDYEVYDIPPGEYYVFFLSEGWSYDAQVGTVINEFYNNTTQWTQATKVTVTEGGTVSGIDFDLQSNSGYVAVTVRNSSGQPLANTVVDFSLYPYLPTEENELLDEGRTLRYGLQTDAGGQVTVGPVPLGTFYMSCQAENFGILYHPNSADPAAAQPLTLATVNQTITGIQFDLPPGGNISGTVTLDDGTPGMFVMVEAYPFGSDVQVAVAMAMNDGSYQLNGLSPGQYAVRAWPGLMFPEYAEEWWDNKPSQSTADLVLVQPGQTTTGIDFVLSQGGSINGAITSDAPGAFEETIFFISAYSLDDSLREVALGLTFGIGPYTLGGLREGDYKVSLQGFPYPMIPLYYDDAHSFEDAAIVTVGMGGVDNIDFALPSRGTITGRVTAPGAADITEVVEFVIAYPEEFPTEDEDFWFLFPAPVQPDGNYTILGLPSGSYRVWVSTQFTEYGEIGFCPEYYGGTSNFEEATPVQVTEGQSTTGIDVQLDREAIVQGFVSLPDGSPAGDADVNVILVAYDAQSGNPVGIGVSDEAPVYTEDNNTFCAGYRIRRLPARPIKIAAVPYGAQAAVGYYGGGHTFDQGGTLTLVAGQTYGSDVNITLDPGTATISGAVTREDGGDPINWVIVASYDLTGHLSGFAPSGINPATDQPWQDGRYEIRSLYSGSTHYLRAWSFISWFWYGMLNPDAVVVITDEWYEELPAEMPPFELGFYMPFGYYYFYGFMPYVQVPFDATQVMAPATNINFTLGFEGQGSDIPTVAPSALSLDAVNPNPCEGLIALSISVGTTQHVFADVLDMAGRLVGSVDLGTLANGSHRVGLDLQAMGHPTTGLYALRLRSAAGSSVQRVVLLR